MCLVAEIDWFGVSFVLDAVELSNVMIADHSGRRERNKFAVSFRPAQDLKLSLSWKENNI